MRINILNIILFTALIAAGFGLTIYLDAPATPQTEASSSKTPAQPALGEPAPNFSFKTLDGQLHNTSEFKGKIILVNFWASWCGPCVLEFPKLLRLTAAHNKNMVLIALSSDIDEAALKTFMKKFLRARNPLPSNTFIGRDPDQSVTQNMFQTYELPETFIIDGASRIREKLIGGDWDSQTVTRLIESLENKEK